MKIVVLDSITVNPDKKMSWKPLEDLGELVVFDQTPRSEILQNIGNAEIAICNKTPMTREVLSSAPNLQCVCLFATGYDAVDIHAAQERGITVCNVPDYSTHGVAQTTLALLLEISNRVQYHTDCMREGAYSTSKKWGMAAAPIMELQGKTVGIVGFGGIGRQFARLCTALDMKVQVYTRTIPKNTQLDIEFVTLNTLLETSDIISLHCPLTPQTQHILDAAAFGRMKSGAILLNTARGGLVEQSALVDALTGGKLLAAGLDVFQKEPIDKDNPLLSLPNCFITPHIGWAAPETRQRLLHLVAKNICCYLDGNPINMVKVT